MNHYLLAAGIFFFLQFVAAQVSPVSPARISWEKALRATTTPPLMTLEQLPPSPGAPVRLLNDSLGVAVTATSSLMIDVATGTVLWQQNADEVRPLASITKLMTVLVALERITDLHTTMTVTKEDYTKLGNATFIVGEQVAVEDLLAATVVASDNTAAQTLARASGLSPEAFVAAMNTKARELKLVKTSFSDPAGLSEKNVSTAREVLVLARTAFRDTNIARYANQRTHTFTSVSGTPHTLKTTNQLIGGMVTVVAGKTGFVTEAGYNLVAEVTNAKGRVLRGVVLGSASNDDRFQDFKMLAYWVWNNYQWPAK